MNTRSILLLIVAVAAGAAFWALAGDADQPAPEMIDAPLVAEESDQPVDTIRSEAAIDEDPQRSQVETLGGPTATTSSSAERSASLAVTGRVVDEGGRPIEDASISLFVRRDMRSAFQGGGGFTGNPQRDMREMRQTLRAELAAPIARTDAEGRYALSGTAFPASMVEMAVEHPSFAPELLAQRWTRTEHGDLTLDDVVLAGGAAVRGRAVGPDGNAVPGAKIQLSSLGRERDMRRGMGRIMARAGADGAMGTLSPTTTADAGGNFTFEHVTAGGFMLRLEAPRHVPAETDDKEAENGAVVDVGDVVLPAGGEIQGRVIDQDGAPVPNAEVIVAASTKVEADQRQPDDARQQRRGRGQDQMRAMLREMTAERQTTRTDLEGRFVLDMVPAKPLLVRVRHQAFLDLEVEPVQPSPTPELELQLQPRPTLNGVVVDRNTGEPVELFGIRARMAPRQWGNFGNGNNRGNRDNEDPERRAQREARDAERRAQQERDQAYRESRLGGAGMVAHSTPDPSGHPEGQFEVTGLQPGEYLLDVKAPGFVVMAAGRFTIPEEGQPEPVLIRLQRGNALRGRVVDANTNKPVSGATLSLTLPPLDGAGAQQQAGGRGGPGGRGGWGGFGGRGDNDRVARVETAADGSYEFPPLLPGHFILDIEADEYPPQHDPNFALLAAQSEQRADFALDPGATVYGLVLDAEQDKQTRIIFTHIESGDRRAVTADAETGRYEVRGLRSGGYLVQVSSGAEGQRDWRSRVGMGMAARMGAEPDLFVPQGGELQFDVGQDALDLATLRGRVYRNGQPGGGLSVQLSPIDDGSAPQDQGSRWMRRGMSRLYNAQVDPEDGSFEIRSVPPGSYNLEVQSGGGGGRGGGRGGRGFGSTAMHSELVVITRGSAPIERVIQVVSGHLFVRITDQDAQPINRALLTLVLAQEAGDQEPETWGDLESHQRHVLREGELDTADVTPGAYRYTLRARGFKTLVGDLVISAQAKPANPLMLVLEPSEPEPQPDENPR